MNEYLKWLGLKAHDVVTGFQGVVTSVSFDISGCIQALITPPTEGKDKAELSRWFDLKRLVAVDQIPVMPAPAFVQVPGGQDLPPQTGQPNHDG